MVLTKKFFKAWILTSIFIYISFLLAFYRPVIFQLGWYSVIFFGIISGVTFFAFLIFRSMLLLDQRVGKFSQNSQYETKKIISETAPAVNIPKKSHTYMILCAILFFIIGCVIGYFFVFGNYDSSQDYTGIALIAYAFYWGPIFGVIGMLLGLFFGWIIDRYKNQ